mmetsp:Transcript_12096/g.20077  ORF Transcript_12096/g.20077 Transcript_12096/m.20077 type:complete len:111 (-) Transcript_12096:97-429(-)
MKQIGATTTYQSVHHFNNSTRQFEDNQLELDLSRALDIGLFYFVIVSLLDTNKQLNCFLSRSLLPSSNLADNYEIFQIPRISRKHVAFSMATGFQNTGCNVDLLLLAVTR